MDFNKRLGKITESSIFRMDGYFVWCGSVVKGKDGLYYLYFSFWDKDETFDSGWLTSSKIGYGVSDNPYGGFEFRGIALDGGAGWDRDSVHNPAVIEYDGRYYMYYVGNYGDGEYWSHRNNQRIGVAVADRSDGPWMQFDTPVIDVSEKGFDSLMVSNPSVTPGKDGKLYMIYKAVENNGKLPKGGAVVCGIAVADNPLGPFVKHTQPVLTNPENEWSVEDAFIWLEDGRYYVLAKDFQGYFTKTEKGDIALFTSENAFDWQVADYPLATRKELPFEAGNLPVHRMERPQLFIEDGVPKALLCACMPKENDEETFNVSIPISRATEE